MLVLTRRDGEKIHIGDNITITITSIEVREGVNPRVRVGIEAPKDIPVHRGEIYNEIQREKDK